MARAYRIKTNTKWEKILCGANVFSVVSVVRASAVRIRDPAYPKYFVEVF